MTSETFAKVAKGLGCAELRFCETYPVHWQYAEVPNGTWFNLGSDGDLLLAILNRAAELKRLIVVLAMCDECEEAINGLHVFDPLEATALAFSQLPECQP